MMILFLFNSKRVNEIDGPFDGPGTVVLGKDGAYIFRMNDTDNDENNNK